MIDRLYTTLQVIATKDVRGNLSAEEFNLILNNVIEEKYEEYFYDATRIKNREARGLVGSSWGNQSANIDEKVRHFYETEVVPKINGAYTAPKNTRYIESLFVGKKQVEVVTASNVFNLMLESDHLRPNERRPIALEMGRSYIVAPDTISTDVQFYFLRNPKRAKWTHDPVTELFNPGASDFRDVDMHPSEEQDILRRLVIKAGVNLNDQELAQYGMVVERKEFEENNTI